MKLPEVDIAVGLLALSLAARGVTGFIRCGTGDDEDLYRARQVPRRRSRGAAQQDAQTCAEHYGSARSIPTTEAAAPFRS